MALFPPKPYNLIDSRVISNTVGATDAAIAKSQLTLQVANPMVIQWKDILPSGFVHTAFAAGTAQITTLDTTLAALVSGTTLTVSLKRLDTNDVQTVQIVIGAAETVVTLKAKIVTAITNLGLSTYTAVSTGANTLTITEVGNIGGFITTLSDTLITVVVGTPHVNSSGTYAEVVQYDSTALAGGQFDKYQFVAKPVIPENTGQANVLRIGQYIVWVEKNDAQFAAFNTQLVSIMDGSFITNAATTEPFIEII